MKLSDHFKVARGLWEHPYPEDQLLNHISFAFTMKGFKGLYFKLKEPVNGMDCFQFEFETERGIFIEDGDMKFNDFIGEWIIDSGADVVSFIKDYIRKDPRIDDLILNPDC